MFDNGCYTIVITGVEPVLFYQGILDEDTFDVVSTSTGDPEMDETQPDHGVATFFVHMDGVMIWKKADGEEVTFTQIIDPLDGSRWFGKDKQATITWLGDLNYEVRIADLASVYDEWDYLCVLDEKKDVLEGSGQKTNFSNVIYSDSPVTFAFQDTRTRLVWTDEAEPAAKEGLTFEAVDRLLASSSWGDIETIMIYTSWMDRYYHVQVFYHENVYEYLCTFDRETNTLTAIDPAGIDFDSFSLYMDKDNFTSTGTFVLETDDTLIWYDDSGVAGDGIAVNPW